MIKDFMKIFGKLTSLQVALGGPQKRRFAVNDWCVAMGLALSWGSREGSLSAAQNLANLPSEGS